MKLAMILCLVFLETTYVGLGIGTCLIIFALSINFNIQLKGENNGI